jgi:hypothetical protein
VENLLKILPVILLSIPSYFIVVTIHELGHILTGLFYGFKFYLFVIGPIGLKRNEQDKVIFYLEKNPALWGGVGGVLPRTENPSNLKVFARVLIAGPLLTLVFGVLVLTLYLLNDSLFLLLVGAMSVAISIATLIPSRSGAFYSDGGRWLRIVRNTKARDVELALFTLIQSSVCHQNYAHINIVDTQTLISYEDPRAQYIGHLFAMNNYKEHGDSAMEESHRVEIKKLEPKVAKSFIRLLDE